MIKKLAKRIADYIQKEWQEELSHSNKGWYHKHEGPYATIAELGITKGERGSLKQAAMDSGLQSVIEKKIYALSASAVNAKNEVEIAMIRGGVNTLKDLQNEMRASQTSKKYDMVTGRELPQ